MGKAAEIGIIGGTGVYDPKILKDPERVNVHTPHGNPSDAMIIGTIGGRKVAFLPRHGADHSIPPHNLNNRANIHAFKELGVERIIAPCAVGSLREEVKPGDVVLADQFIDRTHGRPSTFYEGGRVCHISVAEPFCPSLRKAALDAGKKLRLPLHASGTYVCVNGPRFSTKAESKVFRQWGADIIGMTLVPECVLAREKEMCYLPIALVTDYDVWKQRPVSAREVLETMRSNVDKARSLIEDLVPKIPVQRDCGCGSALKDSVF